MQEEKYRTGLVPSHTYSSLAGLGSVDLYTGGFSVALPLLSLPGRAGHDLNLTLAYNSKQIVRYPYLSGHAVRFYDEGYTVGHSLTVSLTSPTSSPTLLAPDRGGGSRLFGSRRGLGRGGGKPAACRLCSPWEQEGC